MSNNELKTILVNEESVKLWNSKTPIEIPSWHNAMIKATNWLSQDSPQHDFEQVSFHTIKKH